MYKIMIVDDEQLTRTFLKTIIPTLHPKWQVVAEPSDGEEACSMLATQHFDLVITDIKMPIMDGVALCEYIHLNFPHIITVILSGYGEFEYAKKAISFNVTNYLLKPIANEELQTMLNEIAFTLDQKTISNLEHLKLLQLSSKYKDEITTNFLQAIISQSHVQIKTLFPLLYQLDINLMDEEGVILLLQQSHITFSEKNTLKNLSLTKLLIYQTALEVLCATDNRVFLDSNSNTLIYMPLNQTIDLKEAVYVIHNSINKAFTETTSIELITYVGSIESDILQLGLSYDNSKKTLLQSMFSATESHVLFYKDNLYSDHINQMTSMISTLGYALSTHDPITTKLMKDNLLEFSSSYILPTTTTYFCFYIINYLCNYLSLDNLNLVDVIDLQLGIDTLENILNKPIMDDLAENKLVSKVKFFIIEHYHEPISLSLIADTLSVSPSYLSNLFHTSVGQSYVKYLTDVRMKQAALLLRSDKKITLEEITKKVGYISVKHFSYVFKKYFNMTTSEYRHG